MRRHIFYLLAVPVLAGLAACSEKMEWDVDGESLIHVTKSDVLFEAAAGNGTVVFEAAGEVTAETDRDWCSATVDGNTVNVSVTENGSLEGRSSQLVLRCGTDSVHVTVQQIGLRFQLSAGGEIVTGSDDEHSLTYDMSSNVPLTFEPDGDWFSVASDGEHLTVNFKENTSGHARIGILRYSSDTFSDSLKVTQYDFDKDIAGPCILTFYETAEGEGGLMGLNAVLSRTALSIPAYGWTIPVTFDSEKARFTMNNGSAMGTYQGYNIYNTVLGGGYYTWSTSVCVLFPLGYDAEAGITFFDMQDAGTWTYPIECMMFYAFNGAAASASAVDSVLRLYAPSIWRMDPQ